MRNLLYHPPEYRSIRALNYLGQFPQTQTLHYPLVLFGGADRAADKLYSDHAFSHYIFSTAMPRISATAARSRRDSSATMVAFTTLCGLRRPIDFVTTLGIPQAVRTARTAPPAITPVPAGAGFSITWELA